MFSKIEAREEKKYGVVYLLKSTNDIGGETFYKYGASHSQDLKGRLLWAKYHIGNIKNSRVGFEVFLAFSCKDPFKIESSFKKFLKSIFLPPGNVVCHKHEMFTVKDKETLNYIITYLREFIYG